MNQIIKTFMSVFFICMVSVIGMGLISASIDAYHADQYISDVVTIIEKSDFSTSVIDACKSKASESGYQLQIHSFDTDDDTHIDMSEILLTYQYTINYLDVVGRSRTLRACAR